MALSYIALVLIFERMSMLKPGANQKGYWGLANHNPESVDPLSFHPGYANGSLALCESDPGVTNNGFFHLTSPSSLMLISLTLEKFWNQDSRSLMAAIGLPFHHHQPQPDRRLPTAGCKLLLLRARG